MGLLSYFKPEKKAASKADSNNEKVPVALNPVTVLDEAQNFQGNLPGRLNVPGSETASLSPAPSTRAAQEDRLVDEIKHQVVLNHLFQHQCSSLWIRDINQQVEGVLVRKRRNEYLFKPPGLATSQFAQAMMMLNVQVRFQFPLSNGFVDVIVSSHIHLALRNKN